MSTPDQQITGKAKAARRLRVTAEWKAGAVLGVMRVRGEIDVDGSRALDHTLRTRVPADCRYVIVDLDEVTLLGAAGVRVLVEHADRLALSARRLVVVASDAHIRRILRLVHASGKVAMHKTVAEAVTACTGPRKSPEPEAIEDFADEATARRDEIFGLRTALRTRPTVARALGVVQERYRLDSTQAFELLRTNAQQHNIPLYSVARAVLTEPRPDGAVWFPGRVRLPAPAISFFQQEGKSRGNRTAVLRSFADEAAAFARTPMVGVDLVDETGPVLRREVFRDLPPALADHTAETRDAAAPAVRAVVDGQRVVVPEVSAQLDLPGRDVLLAAGIAGMQCTPLVTVAGKCVGALTTYHHDSAEMPKQLRLAKLDFAATEIATWLDWHAGTALRDALEQIHASARTT